MASESAIEREIRLTVGGRDDVIIYRNTVGQVLHNGRWVRYGLCKGSADLVGVQRIDVVCPVCGTHSGPFGRFVGIEVKTPRGVVAEHQKLWIELVRTYGGNAYVARSAAEAINGLERPSG